MMMMARVTVTLTNPTRTGVTLFALAAALADSIPRLLHGTWRTFGKPQAPGWYDLDLEAGAPGAGRTSQCPSHPKSP
jgi:hypothetical protein